MPATPLHPATTPSPHRLRRRLQRLPVFTLYGEPQAPTQRLLHIETIQARSAHHDWEIDAHVHHGLHQLIAVHAGGMQARLDTALHTAQGPAIAVVPPGTAHAFHFHPGTLGHVLTFDAALLAEAEGEGGPAGQALQALFTQPLVLQWPAAWLETAQQQRLWEILYEHTQLAARADPTPLWLARAILWQLAQLQRRLHVPLSTERPARSAHYTRWLVLVEQHYRHHWPITRYAQTLGLSTERLNRLVRAETGQSAQQYLHARLLREACRWLLHVPVPVAQIAFELGFEDAAYFGRFFKRHTGCSPGLYRQRHQVTQTVPT